MKKVGVVLMLAVGAALSLAGGTRLATRAADPRAADPRAADPRAADPAAARVPPPVPARQVEDPEAVYRVPIEDSPTRGPADALVTIVEASDLECPFCKRVAPTLRQLEEAYPGKLRFVFKHFPLGMHRNAIAAASVAEEARDAGGDARFFEARERLLELPSLERGPLEAAAAALGLAPDKVKAALDGRHVDRIRRDQDLLGGLGVRGTPTVFVNGRKLVGAQPPAAFKALVEEELAKAERLVKGGVKPAQVYARLTEKGATAAVMIAGPALPAAPAAPSSAAKVPVRADDPARGPAAAPVTVVLFSDFQCPFCSRVGPTLQQIEQAYGPKARITWKHLPLAFHPNALPAAKAAEAARAQGKFWEMHDRLFAGGQQALSESAYLKAAKELGLDVARFRKDMASAATARRIAEDQQLAASIGATGTPTLFVNCRRIVGAQPFEAFRVMIDDELGKAEARAVREPMDRGFYDRTCAANVAAAPAPAAPAPTEVKVALRPDDPARGGSGAKVTVVEFSDFQCPFCSRAVPAVKEVERKFQGDVRVVWKHLPLPFHPNAMPAALAAEAARQQGKFWEMHDRLFAGQQSLSDSAYVQHAKELGLDLARFERSLRDPATRRRVEEDAQAAAAAGVDGTPTFVVNGEPVAGAARLEDAVRRHLEKARVAKR